MDRWAGMGASLRAEPAGKAASHQALSQAALEHYEGTGQPFGTQQMAAIRLLTSSPTIRGEYLKVTAAAQIALAEAIADRTGAGHRAGRAADDPRGRRDRRRAGRPHATASADLPVSLRPLLRLALRQLASAFRAS